MAIGPPIANERTRLSRLSFAILERLADDHDLGSAAGSGQHAGGALDARNAPFRQRPLAAPGPPQLGRAQHVGPDTPRGGQDTAVRRQHLREALFGLPGRARRRRAGGDDGVAAHHQPGGHALVEVVAQPLVDERSGADQHERHRDGERGGQPHADGHPAHDPPSLRSR